MRSTLAGGGDSSVALKLCTELQFVVHATYSYLGLPMYAYTAGLGLYIRYT